MFQLLIEARVRLIAGLKSLFFEKKSAGLLSNQVCTVCETCSEISCVVPLGSVAEQVVFEVMNTVSVLQGLRVLNSVCNKEVDNANTPIAMYDGICREVLSKRRVMIVSRISFHLTKWIMNIRKQNKLVRILFSPLR